MSQQCSTRLASAHEEPHGSAHFPLLVLHPWVDSQSPDPPKAHLMKLELNELNIRCAAYSDQFGEATNR